MCRKYCEQTALTSCTVEIVNSIISNQFTSRKFMLQVDSKYYVNERRIFYISLNQIKPELKLDALSVAPTYCAWGKRGLKRKLHRKKNKNETYSKLSFVKLIIHLLTFVLKSSSLLEIAESTKVSFNLYYRNKNVFWSNVYRFHFIKVLCLCLQNKHIVGTVQLRTRISTGGFDLYCV